ncbi:MAG: hypothetical protein RR307_05380 [Clostridia bacterium]
MYKIQNICYNSNMKKVMYKFILIIILILFALTFVADVTFRVVLANHTQNFDTLVSNTSSYNSKMFSNSSSNRAINSALNNNSVEQSINEINSQMAYNKYIDEGFEGVYLIGSTSITTDGELLYICQNVTIMTNNVKSYIMTFRFENGSIVEVGERINFKGEIKRIRYGSGQLFAHIGDSLYMVCNGESRIISVNENLIAFDADESNIYTLIESVEGKNCLINSTPINDLIDSGTQLPQSGSILGLSNPLDLIESNGNLYILGDMLGIRSVIKRNIMDNSDTIFKNFVNASAANRIHFFGQSVAICNKGMVWILPESNEKAIPSVSFKANGVDINIVDCITMNNNKEYFLNVCESDGKIEVKEYRIKENTFEFVQSILGNNAVRCNLPDFNKMNIENSITSGKYKLACAMGYPSNLVYTVEGKNKGFYLNGMTLKSTDMFLILDYDSAKEFYLILFDGKLGFISKNVDSLAIKQENFVISTHIARQSANQKFMVFSLPATTMQNAYATLSVSDAINNPKNVNVIFELNGFDAAVSNNAKWTYISYSDKGELKYGFALKGDLKEIVQTDTVYTEMRANPEFGAKLNIYSIDSVLSDVVGIVNSGKKVRVYKTNGDLYFISVEIDGKTVQGYALSSKLIKKNKFTVNESAGILFILGIVALSGFTIFFIVYHKRHNKSI